MAPKNPKPEMKLYYVGGYNGSIVTYDYTTFSASGVVNKYMSKSDFSTYTKDILNATMQRTPKHNSTNLPSIFTETITIISPPYQEKKSSNMITATATYPDPTGTRFFTGRPYVNFNVTGASGKFKDYTNMKIEYDNSGEVKKRTVILS